MRTSVLAALMLASLVLVPAARADDEFHPVPQAPGLELRVVKYGQGVHGEMVVEVRNTGSAEATFVASGLYFTPDEDDEGTAPPQRLAVVGGIRAGSEDAHSNQVSLAAGKTRRMRFDVYCIDEDRHSPSQSQAFTLASQRLPTKVSSAIDRITAPVLRDVKLKPDAQQAGTIQGLVWEARRRARARLLGEH